MCGRYNALTEEEMTQVRLMVHKFSMRLTRDDLKNYKTQKEVRPTDKAPTLTQNSDGVALTNSRFGFMRWDGRGVIINARAETIKSKRTFSGLLSTNRCVVPASEYYEWKIKNNNEGKSKPSKIKYTIKDPDGNLLFFAGLYKDGDEGREFVIITKEPCGKAAEIHDRMPVCLKEEQVEKWLESELSPEDLVGLDFYTSVMPFENA